MDKFHTLKRAGILTLALAALFCGLYAFSRALGYDALGTGAYNTYTLQALSWREGRMSLGRDYPHLELAVFMGDYYVSFPPTPSAPLYLLTFIFGAATPDGLLVKLYMLIAFAAMYVQLEKRGGWWRALFYAAMFAFASSMLPLTLTGAVWYQAQTMAFMFMTVSLVCAIEGRYTISLICYALAVGCRPFDAVYFLPLAAIIIKRGFTIKKLAPGVIAGLAIGIVYAWYNYARFGAPLEFGHNFLPEFTRSENGQFSIAYLMQNLKTVFWTLPWNGAGEWEQFGFNIFMANPVYICLAVWAIGDIVRRRMNLALAGCLVGIAVELFLLMLHKSFGGFQFGLRYAADMLPCAYAYFYLSGRGDKTRWWEAVVLAGGLAFMVAGTVCVHI